jgi:hypothetical protein
MDESLVGIRPWWSRARGAGSGAVGDLSCFDIPNKAMLVHDGGRRDSEQLEKDSKVCARELVGLK